MGTTSLKCDAAFCGVTSSGAILRQAFELKFSRTTVCFVVIFLLYRCFSFFFFFFFFFFVHLPVFCKILLLTVLICMVSEASSYNHNAIFLQNSSVF